MVRWTAMDSFRRADSAPPALAQTPPLRRSLANYPQPADEPPVDMPLWTWSLSPVLEHAVVTEAIAAADQAQAVDRCLRHLGISWSDKCRHPGCRPYRLQASFAPPGLRSRPSSWSSRSNQIQTDGFHPLEPIQIIQCPSAIPVDHVGIWEATAGRSAVHRVG